MDKCPLRASAQAATQRRMSRPCNPIHRPYNPAHSGHNRNRPRRRLTPPHPLIPILRKKTTTFGPWRSRLRHEAVGKDHTDSPTNTAIVPP